jgi:hypothetical protein
MKRAMFKTLSLINYYVASSIEMSLRILSNTIKIIDR